MSVERLSFSIPSRVELGKLEEYAELLSRFGFGAPEVVAFYNANQHLPGFAANARDLDILQREDDDLSKRRESVQLPSHGPRRHQCGSIKSTLFAR
jgi:hypothetical protein